MDTLPAPRTLRDYQSEAVSSVNAEWDDGIQRTSVVAATGLGKSTIMSALANQERTDNGGRVLILAHRRELLDSISETVDEINPSGQTPGIVMGADYTPDTDIVCASFQTLARSPKKRKAIGHRDLILVDECHHIMAKTYLKTLANFGLDVDPEMTKDQMRALSADDVVRTGERIGGVRACGFTATMTRADGEKLGAVWQTIAFERDLKWAIDNGFLVPPRGLTVKTPELNLLNSLKTVGGDFKQSELDEVMRASIPTTVDSVLRHCGDRVPIIFAVSVEQGAELAAELTARGFPTAAVSGSHSRTERQDIYRRFRNGELRAMVTVQVLTEGADFPRCDCVVLARPTRSDVLFAQIVGRGVRLYTDPKTGAEKKAALVVDLTGMLRDKKLATLTQLYAEAETVTVDTDGEVIEEPAPAGAGMPFDPTPERQGEVDLEEVDLFIPDMPRVRVDTTPNGVTFLPSPQDAEGEVLFLWPPAAEDADDVYLLHYSGGRYGGGEITIASDNSGAPISESFSNALSAAGKLAENNGLSTKRIRSTSMKANEPPTTRMVALANSVGIASPHAMSRRELSVAISGAKLDTAVRNRLAWISAQGLI